MTEPERTDLEVVRALYDATARGDLDGAAAVLDDDVVWIEAEGGPYGGTYHGPEAVVEEVWTPLAEEWPEFTTDVDRFVEDDGTIVALATYRGTYGETGKRFEAPVAHVFDIEDGKVVRFQQYVDTVLHTEPMA